MHARHSLLAMIKDAFELLRHVLCHDAKHPIILSLQWSVSVPQYCWCVHHCLLGRTGFALKHVLHLEFHWTSRYVCPHTRACSPILACSHACLPVGRWGREAHPKSSTAGQPEKGHQAQWGARIFFHTHTHIHTTQTHAHTHTHIHTHIHANKHKYLWLHTNTHACALAHTHTHTHILVSWVQHVQRFKVYRHS